MFSESPLEMVSGIRSLLKFTPPFETVIAGRSSIYVFSESPFEMVGRIRSLLKFTPQVTSITFKFTTRVTFKFSAHQVYYQCHLQVYCQSHLHIYPPFETVIADRSSIGRCMSSVRAHLKLLKFTCKFYPPINQAQIYGIPLHRSFTYSRMHKYFRQMYPHSNWP